MQRWVAEVLGSDAFELRRASSDASFRSYWRLLHAGGTAILMDAPPAQEDCGRFADLSRRFRAVGVNTPEVFAEDRLNGFLLLSDFGDQVYLRVLDAANVDRLYGDALATLAILQAHGPTQGLPVFDAAFIRRELDLFHDWFLAAFPDVADQARTSGLLGSVARVLVENALEQPRVCMHRDYHSRNLMQLEHANPGVLDFQDAVVGPVTYDLVSLLRDCYITWPADQVIEWATGYCARAGQQGGFDVPDRARFLRWFDLMGVQRHLKACGIFARLHRRDGKSHYLTDIPRTLAYILAVAPQYPELAALARLLEQQVCPRLEQLSVSQTVETRDAVD
ncbi:aminoglycoside phosphotransferase [Thiocapsa imhoffii]|uniref:Aminoglycoside phosphotransferase n=2 Tax=Thiocapsa imhoffii TaxID=382777 RepID=A0A9X1B9Z1_9GAMM|nr:phosphotransferase [Thiocapsa imhoffii]MBK1645575.1 aminoglycoside phosphotransferase [Thiocapsa imhoffii]